MNGTFIESQTVDAFFHVFNFLVIFALYDNSWDTSASAPHFYTYARK